MQFFFRRLLHLLLFFSAILFTRLPARAESFKVLGSRPLGMGGAFVAVAEDSLAAYWNPAGIAPQKNMDLEIPVNVKAEFTGQILKDADTISDLADRYSRIQSAQKNGSALNADDMAAFLKTAETLGGMNKPDKGVLVEAHGGLNLRLSRFALTVNNFTSAGATPMVDTVNLGLGASAGNAGVSFAGANAADPSGSELLEARNNAQAAIDTIGYANIQNLIGSAGLAAGGITNSQQLANALVNAASGLTNAQVQDAARVMKESAPGAKPIVEAASSGNPYSANTSNATLRGISMLEVGLGYGSRLFLKDLYWGVNLKLLAGKVGYARRQFLNEDVSGKDVFEDFDKNTKTSLQPGVDLGLLLDKRQAFRTKLGLVAKNLNSPKFEQPDVAAAAGEQKYRVPPQVRAGVAVYPFRTSFWAVTSDLDLTNNITPVPGFSSRIWALGTEFNLLNSESFNLGLRAGVMNNLTEEASKPTLTGGIGLRFFHFFLDIAGAVSTASEDIKTDSSGKTERVPQNGQVGVALGLDW